MVAKAYRPLLGSGNRACAQGSKVLYFNVAKITGTNQKWQESMEAYLNSWAYCPKESYLIS